MKMISIIVVCIALILSTTIVNSESDTICCTWVNVDYTGNDPPQKIIYNHDGTFASYPTKESTNPIQRGTFSIMKKWNDSEGNSWYQIKWDGQLGSGYNLAKVSDFGKKLEFVMAEDNCPIKIDITDSSYCKYDRI